MRSFDDAAGGHWQAALLEASYGNILLVFSCIDGEGVLKKPIDADSLLAAEQVLARMEEGRLRELLAEAEPWS